jgi:hypothetical protein
VSCRFLIGGRRAAISAAIRLLLQDDIHSVYGAESSSKSNTRTAGTERKEASEPLFDTFERIDERFTSLADWLNQLICQSPGNYNHAAFLFRK